MDPNAGQRHTPGWYPDPLGRFELRYHNGQAWTGDVSRQGQRFVDPINAAPPLPYGAAGPAAGQMAPGGYPMRPARNGAALTALVLGIVGATTAWMPFVVVIGGIAALLALVFGVLGRRAARPGGSAAGVRGGMANAGLILGALGLLMVVPGVLLTRWAIDVVDPGRHEVAVMYCESSAGRAVARGTITNLGDDDQGYTLFVSFYRAGTSSSVGQDIVGVDSLAPGESGGWVAAINTDVEAVDCQVDEVIGALPVDLG